MRAEAARLAAIPNPIACYNLVICRMAGKAFVFDHFKVSQMIATGAYSWDEIAAMTHAQGISFEAVDPRARTISLFRRCPKVNGTWYYILTGRATVWGFTLDCYR